MWFIHMYMQLGCSASWRDHPGVRPAGRSLVGLDDPATAGRLGLQEVAMNCHVVPTTTSPAVRGDLVGVGAPVLAPVVALCLEQVDGRLELLLVRADTGR